jgi:hypothetical protein
MEVAPTNAVAVSGPQPLQVADERVGEGATKERKSLRSLGRRIGPVF